MDRQGRKCAILTLKIAVETANFQKKWPKISLKWPKIFFRVEFTLIFHFLPLQNPTFFYFVHFALQCRIRIIKSLVA